MARILSISSQVAYGAVGNSAAVPPMQQRNHEVIQVPTILLSNHPGLGTPAGSATPPDLLKRILEKIAERAGPSGISAVMTGYFADAQQIEIVGTLIEQLKSENPAIPVLVDPVIGDHGRLYVADEVAKAMKGCLVPLATVATPNLFELSWLTQSSLKTRPDCISAARGLELEEVLVTSVMLQKPQSIETILVTRDLAYGISMPKRENVPNGTGDYLAGAYLSRRLEMPANTAFRKAMKALATVIAASDGHDSLAVATRITA